MRKQITDWGEIAKILMYNENVIYLNPSKFETITNLISIGKNRN